MPLSYGTTNIAPYASAPAVGPAGSTYYNTTSKTEYISDGTNWNAVAGGGYWIFANAAARDAAIPSPSSGMQCWLTDTDTPWAYHDGAWHGMPLGVIASQVGPSVQLDMTTYGVVFSLTFTAKVGRLYRITSKVEFTTVTANSTLTVVDTRQNAGAGAYRSSIYYSLLTTAASSQYLTDTGLGLFSVPSTQTVGMSIQAQSSTGSACRFAPNLSCIFVEDVGT